MLKYLRLTPLFCAAFGAAVGFYFLSIFSLFTCAVFIFASLVILCLFRVLSSLDRRRRLLRITAVCSAAFSVALMLGLCASYVGRTETFFSIPVDKVAAVEGVLTEDPRIISGGRAMVTFSLQRCAASNTAGERGLRADSSGELTVFFRQENAEKLREFGRGTTVFAEGVLREDNQGGWTFSASSMHVVKPASAVERMRTGIRLNLISRFEGKEWGGLALALLLGIKDNLDTNLAAMYRDAGCSYILALSGMHLAVLAALIAFLLKKPLGLKAASVAGALIILLYCFIVGPMPSLNRAALMYLLGVIAILGALPRKPLSILSLSFLIQIVITSAAGNSISFILSYLALAGILIITPPLYSLFAGKVPDFLLKPLSASGGAFLSTAGITSFSFGIIVPMGIVTGLVLVPLTTVFMIGSIIWLVLDLLSISAFFNMPLLLLYRIMESIVSVAGNIGGISMGSSRILPLIILVLSLVLSLLIFIFENRQREARQRLEPFP